MEIKDCIAFVTGANGGIGSALVSELSTAGATAITASRS